ncbi:hypothetical protein G6O69_04235 [Pseudenhygromyxa sp. WMMC2535]|uniref:hypothetical protein n=1 Tax=Pseudenhygromyxa sp. WMMC2535 TaxID=2712867 RepID=UPI00155357B6|nr:hypothetical protein [Pseudenhygromyxa sp. WMMC2535]NVB37026.1 hypothetical protein [Pseudenhygromyxa sp. WMMC2535]
MKGDFTRGFQPDQARGKRYRRVLLQQGRVLLDSDHAALVDATDRSLRELAVDLGCRAGSPDYGFLTTPGVLRRVFDSLTGVSADASVAARLDYEHRYDKFPSLYLEGSGGGAGVVSIDLIPNAEDSDALVLWVRVEGGTTFGVKRPEDAAFTDIGPVTSTSFTRVELGFGETDTLEIELDPGERVWIGLIETNSGVAERWLSVAAGRYYLGGMVLENPSIAPWPAQAFVTPSEGALTPISDLIGGDDGYVLAYLEGWERLHTRHQDPGILEQALGGELDTTVRSELVGQVKIIPLSSLPDEDVLYAAFMSPDRGDGELSVDVAAETVDTDPCAVPVEGGYTGRDNRLYRFEVHAAESTLASTLLKWSRDNGSELEAIVGLDGAEVTLSTATELRDGDLVEVLSEVIALGDESLASYASESLRPAQRMVGELAVLVEQEPDSNGRPVFRLGQLDAPDTAISLPEARYGALGADAQWLRRWHGIVRGEDGASHDIEDGIAITLSGEDFEVGAWWSYEARTLTANANGEWQSTPHGPERRFAPLGMFSLPVNSGDPLTLVGWADDRFSNLCSTNADDIPYDGDGVCSDAATVQEAIDELYRKSSCCELKFGPCHAAQIPDEQLIAELITSELQDGGVLCLGAGLYSFESPLDIDALGLGGELTIRGCEGAVIESTGDHPLFTMKSGQLTLENLILVNQSDGTAHQVELLEVAKLVARDVAFVVASPDGAALSDGSSSAVEPSPDVLLGEPLGDGNPSPPSDGPSVALHGCTVLAGDGLRFGVLAQLELRDCALRAVGAAVSATWVSEPQIHDSVVTGLLAVASDIPSTQSLRTNPGASLAIARDFEGYSGGVALSCIYTLGGEVANNRIAGAPAIFVDCAWRTRFADNTINCGELAMILNQSVATGIIANQVVSEGAGLRVGVLARFLTIEGNLLACTGGYGIALCESPGDLSAELHSVRVSSNQVSTSATALSIWPDTGADGKCADVVISSNQFRGPSSGSYGVRLNRFGSASEGVGVSFIDNHIRQSTGIVLELQGEGIVAQGNYFSLGSKGGVIYAHGAPGVSITRNRLDLVDCDETTVALEIAESDRAQISGNQFELVGQSSEPVPIRALKVGDRVTISDNQVCAGQSLISSCTRLRVIDNTMQGSLMIYGASDGEVCGNRAEGVFDYEDEYDSPIESILIHTVQGHWRVCDNKCPNGALRLMPAVEDGGLEVAYKAIVTDNLAARLQVGWLGDVNVEADMISIFEDKNYIRSDETAVIITENICTDHFVSNDYFNHSIRTHNIAPKFFANFSTNPSASGYSGENVEG